MIVGRRSKTLNIELDRNDWVGDWIKSLAYRGYTREDFVSNKDGIRNMVEIDVERLLIKKWGKETVEFFFEGKVFKHKKN